MTTREQFSEWLDAEFAGIKLTDHEVNAMQAAFMAGASSQSEKRVTPEYAAKVTAELETAKREAGNGELVESVSVQSAARANTPRTDEEVEIAKKYPATSHGLFVSADFARQLERELAAKELAISLTRTILAGTDAGSLPNDFPVDGMAAERMKDLLNTRRELESLRSSARMTDEEAGKWLAVFLGVETQRQEEMCIAAAGTLRRQFAQSASERTCPYCTSDNPAIRSTYYDQTCEGCVKRMGQT